MIKSEVEYIKEMRNMVKRVQSGEHIDTQNASIQDLEILCDCIKLGYINGTIEKNGVQERTLDGKIHPTVFNAHIPLKGIAFLHPKPDWKFLLPLLISLVALVKSFL